MKNFQNFELKNSEFIFGGDLLRTHNSQTCQRDLYDEDEYDMLLWSITELLVKDLEAKLTMDETHDKVRMYGQPLNETFKSVSDRYIFKAAFLALSAVLKLNLKFEDHFDLLERIAVCSCKLYQRVEKNKEYRRWVFDVICTFYNSAAFSKFLDGLDHPLLAAENPHAEEENEVRASEQ